MKKSYAKILQQRFIYTYLVTILSILVITNYNYISVIEHEIDNFLEEVQEHAYYLEYKQTTSTQELSRYTILKSALQAKGIPLYIEIDKQIYTTNFVPHNDYYMFILGPILVLTLILFFLYFSIYKVVDLGLKRLALLEDFLEGYFINAKVDEKVFKKIEAYNDDIYFICKRLSSLISNDQERLKQQKRFMQKLEEVHEVILSFDMEYKIIESNKSWNEIKKESSCFTDYITQKNIDTLERNMFSLKNRLLEHLTLTDTLLSEESVYEIKIIYSDGEFSAIIRDITAMHISHEKVKYISLHDSLTGLANRDLFIEKLKSHIQKAKRESNIIAILFFDLNDFKSVNDCYDHKVGDEVLKDFARRVVLSLRESDTLARFGGDEFLAILPDMKDDNVESIILKIRDSLKEPFRFDGITLQMQTSIGVAFYPYDDIHVEGLILKADKAMYESKKKNLPFFLYKEI